MCGIAVYYNARGVHGRVVMNRMLEQMSHRGPDNASIVLDSNVLFGHTRLSIIDTESRSNQPMKKDDMLIVFNGEIYNYIENRTALREMYRFSTESDTEVLLRMYDQYGASMYPMLNGMWAFVVWDSVNKVMHISRDRLGQKPLYYSVGCTHLAIASEITAMFEAEWIYRDPSREYLVDFLEKGQKYVYGRRCYKDIKEVKPGEYLEISLQNDEVRILRNTRYWSINACGGLASSEEWSKDKLDHHVKEIDDLLNASVSLRMRSDVGYAVALSGGLDSSSILHYAKNNTPDEKKPVAISNIYSSVKYKHLSEEKYIDIVAGSLGIEAQKYVISYDSLLEDRMSITRHMELPYDGTLLAPYHLYKTANLYGHKVLLEGQGADEQLAGYPAYFKNYFNTSGMTESIKTLLRCPLSVAEKIQMLACRLLKYSVRDVETRSNYLCKHLHDLKSVLVSDTQVNLSKHLLYADRLAMAHSIENRLPFLDYKFVEAVCKLPVAYLLHNGYTKYILRVLMARRLPKRVVWRKSKYGFPSPDKEVYDTMYKNYYKDMYNRSHLVHELGLVKDDYENYSTAKKIRLLNLLTWEMVHNV